MLQVYNGEKGEYHHFKVELESRLKTEVALFPSVNENDAIFGRKRVPILHIFPMNQEWNARGHPYMIAKISAELAQEARKVKEDDKTKREYKAMAEKSFSTLMLKRSKIEKEKGQVFRDQVVNRLS